MPRTEVIIEYTEEYKQACKQAWYAGGRSDSSIEILNAIPEDVHGRKPNIATIRKWRKEDLWDIWADELDSRAMTIVEDNLVIQKVEMLKRHAETGAKLQELGIAHLASGTFDSSSAAVSAVIRGAELERTSRGIGDLIQKMAHMDDGDLKAEIMKYINRASENDQMVIDVDPASDKEEETENDVK